MPVLLLLLPAFPARAEQRRNADSFDLFYGLLVFLALAVFILGALTFTFVAAISYVEALARTSLTVTAALLLLAWAWNPRGGFSGIGSAFSRYLLSLGLPLEQWLVMLAETSERESHPVRFLETSVEGLSRMPWVGGCRWRAGNDAGQFGKETPHSQNHERAELVLTIYFRQQPSPALRWHVEWLLRLIGEFYLVKFQAHKLRRMGYLQAVYETGARVTHDVKSLLQSLQTLCYAVTQPGDQATVAQLLARQLPQIAERLKATLDKLQRPQIQAARGIAANACWARLQEDGIEITVDFSVDRSGPVLCVRDNGQAVAPAVLATLFRAPTESASGLGIGLYHAARQAEEIGYRLTLTENRTGAVCFRLSAAG